MLALRNCSHTCSRRAAVSGARCIIPSPTHRRITAAPRLQRLHAAETEEAATSTSDEPDAQSNHSISPIQRARDLIAAEETDKAALESALADLDTELASLSDEAAAATSRASLLENSAASVKDQLVRLSADFDNFRRRSKEEKDALADSVRGDVVQQLLPLVDNFELARTQVKVETDAEQRINNSYQSLYKQMVEIMRGLGIEAVPTVGAAFDPNVHEAIMQEPNAEVEDGTVLMEFRKGFRLGDKLLRPAMVKVSVREGDAPAAASSNE